MVQVNNFEQLASLIESDKLTNKQIYSVVLSTMKLLLSEEEENLPRKELTKRLRVFYDKWIVTGVQITPFFLDLDLKVK